MATVAAPMTTEELLALPNDGMERWLIAGELRERPMTVRNRFHRRAMIRVGKFLDNWLDEQPSPCGQVLGGDRTVTVYRPGTEPDSFNIHQELSGEPHLPGFRVPVARLFE